MEEEKEQLKKRLERMRKKVCCVDLSCLSYPVSPLFSLPCSISLILNIQIESLPGHEKMLAAARSLRLEREREESIATARIEQKNQVFSPFFY